MTAPDRTDPADALGRFLDYANRLDSLMGVRHRPAYAETCCCGASCEIGADVEARERRRLANLFIGRHQHCTRPDRNADLDLAASAPEAGQAATDAERARAARRTA